MRFQMDFRRQPPPLKGHDDVRQSLAGQVEDYLRRGGMIEQLPVHVQRPSPFVWRPTKAGGTLVER